MKILQRTDYGKKITIMNISIQTTDKEGKDIISMLNAFLDGVAANFLSLNTKIDTIMADVKTAQGLLDRLNTATNAQAARLKDLKDQVAEAIKDKGIAADQEDKIFSAFDQEISVLEKVGQDPTNPVPDPTTPAEPGA